MLREGKVFPNQLGLSPVMFSCLLSRDVGRSMVFCENTRWERLLLELCRIHCSIVVEFSIATRVLCQVLCERPNEKLRHFDEVTILVGNEAMHYT